MTCFCPSCGQAILHDAPAKWDAEARTVSTSAGSVTLTYRVGRIFDVLWRMRGTGFIRRDVLAERVYADKDDGGPVWADVAISVQISTLRLLIAPLGLSIEGQKGPGGGVRLVIPKSEYDAMDDFSKSIALGFQTIRERVAAGGPGWQRKDDSAAGAA